MPPTRFLGFSHSHNSALQRAKRSQHHRLTVPLHRRFAAAVRSTPRQARWALVALVLLFIWVESRLRGNALRGRTEPVPVGAGSAKEATQVKTKPKQAGGAARQVTVPFVSTQHRRQSIKVHFAARGDADPPIVQEIFVPLPDEPTTRLAPSLTAGLAGGAEESAQLWEEGSISRFEVPLGVGVVLVKADGTTAAISRGRGDGCEDDGCDGVKSVRVLEDVALGLRQLQELDDSLSSNDRKTVHRSLPRLWPRSTSITLCVQLTPSRLARFERLRKAWDGPISAVVYLLEEGDGATFASYWAASKSKWDDTSLTLVRPSYAADPEARRRSLRYPINYLRNLALEAAETDYTLTMDVDFVPSPGLHASLVAVALPSLAPLAGSHDRPKRAIVLPAYISLPSQEPEVLPTTFEALRGQLQGSPPKLALPDPNGGHGPSALDLLLSSSGTAGLFEVCYETQWEPYLLLPRSSPAYDERFTDQGGDKQSHVLTLNVLQYQFLIFNGGCVVHPRRRVAGESQGAQEPEGIDEWPSVLLDRLEATDFASNGTAAGHQKEKNTRHFSSAQGDGTRFRYFQDFLPEMEERWGSTFRWPRGCSAQLVGRRNHGRANEARAAWGM